MMPRGSLFVTEAVAIAAVVAFSPSSPLAAPNCGCDAFSPPRPIAALLGPGFGTAAGGGCARPSRSSPPPPPPPHCRRGGPALAAASASTLRDESLAPGMAAIDAALPTLSPLLSELRSLPYFRLYSVDMLASCEYLPQELFECYTESCEIYPADDADVPPGIRGSDFDEHDFELDGWARWDMPSEDYYDTLLFPEDYTGYDGSDVWKFIHGRIGFHGGGMTNDEYDADDWKADFNKVCRHYLSQTVVR